MTNLREACERYLADEINGFDDAESYNKGFTAALDLLWPCVESALKAQNFFVENTCDECGTYQEVRYEVKPAVDVIKELKAKVTKGDGERDGA